MSTPFKDQLAHDIGAVWFNNDEFSDWHTIDGQKMHVLFDEHELTKNDTSQSKRAEEGIYRDLLLIYVPCDEFGPRPRTGRTLILDGKKNYRIVDVMTEDGVFAMQLEAYKG